MNDGPYREETRTYVLRIWREEGDHSERTAHWRGYIVEVISKKKIYIQSTSDVTDFLHEQLRELGVSIKRRYMPLKRLFGKD